MVTCKILIKLRETVLMGLINNFQYEQGNLVNIVWILIYTFVRNTCVCVCVCVIVLNIRFIRFIPIHNN